MEDFNSIMASINSQVGAGTSSQFIPGLAQQPQQQLAPTATPIQAASIPPSESTPNPFPVPDSAPTPVGTAPAEAQPDSSVVPVPTSSSATTDNSSAPPAQPAPKPAREQRAHAPRPSYVQAPAPKEKKAAQVAPTAASTSSSTTASSSTNAVTYASWQSAPPIPVQNPNNVSENDLPPQNLPPGPRSKNKPTYSYASMIGQAILASERKKLSLVEIYNWISAAYPFYNKGEGGWMNSIRHNLSLNKSFQKMERDFNGPQGKGMLWGIVPGCESQFEGGRYRKPRPGSVGASSSTSSPPQQPSPSTQPIVSSSGRVYNHKAGPGRGGKAAAGLKRKAMEEAQAAARETVGAGGGGDSELDAASDDDDELEDEGESEEEIRGGAPVATFKNRRRANTGNGADTSSLAPMSSSPAAANGLHAVDKKISPFGNNSTSAPGVNGDGGINWRTNPHRSPITNSSSRPPVPSYLSGSSMRTSIGGSTSSVRGGGDEEISDVRGSGVSQPFGSDFEQPAAKRVKLEEGTINGAVTGALPTWAPLSPPLTSSQFPSSSMRGEAQNTADDLGFSSKYASLISSSTGDAQAVPESASVSTAAEVPAPAQASAPLSASALTEAKEKVKQLEDQVKALMEAGNSHATALSMAANGVSSGPVVQR